MISCLAHSYAGRQKVKDLEIRDPFWRLIDNLHFLVTRQGLFVALHTSRPIWRPVERASLNSGSATGHSIRVALRSRVDLDRRRHAADEANTRRYLINPDVHRHTLTKPYSSEDRVHRGKPLLVWLRV
jgi:hypothetical protein